MPTNHIDLRSDTLTVPDAGMRAAMAAAEVGDDVWGEDPTVRALEERVAALLGKDAAVFVPSGTMGNLASVAAQTVRGDEVIADSRAHIVLYEVGGAAAIAGVQVRTIECEDGIPDAEMVAAAVREPDIHNPVTRLLCIENTHNRRGGAAATVERVQSCADAAHRAGLRVHCDGARLFNAAIAVGCTVAALAAPCDTVSVCLSKGLGAPVGSVVSGEGDVIAEVRRWRKRLGGGMRQAGVLAAAGMYALDHNVDRLADDHANAARMVRCLKGAGRCRVVWPAVPTNIVLIETDEPAELVVARAAEAGVLISRAAPHAVRCVTHLGVGGDECESAASVIAAAADVRAA